MEISKLKVSKKSIFMFSYIIVFLIPVITSGILGYLLINHYVINPYLGRIEDAAINQSRILESYSDNFDIIYSNVNQKSFFRNEYMRENRIEAYYAIEDFLSENENRNEIISKLYFYNTVTKKIHASNGTTSEAYFFSSQFSKDFLNNNTFKHIMEPTLVQGIDFCSPNPLLMLIMPIEKEYFNNTYVSYLIFKINYPFLESLFNTSNIAEKSDQILYYKDKPVFSTKEALNEQIIAGDNKWLMDGTLDGMYVVNGEKLYRLKVNFLLNQKEFKRNVYSLVVIQSITLLVVVVICLLVIIFLLKQYFKPIENLIKKVKSTVGVQIEIEDEYQLFDFVFEELVSNNEALEDMNDSLVKEKLLYHILRNNKGRFEPHFIKECKIMDIKLEEEAYLCVIVNQLNRNKLNLIDIIKEKNEALITDNNHYEISMTEYQSIILFCGNKTDVEAIYDVFETIKNEVIEEMFIGVGLIARKLHRINRSFNYAQMTAQYALENNQFICLKLNKNINKYPKLDFDILESAVYNHQIDKIVFALNNLKSYIIFNNDFFISACIYNQCLQILSGDMEGAGILAELKDYQLNNLFKETPSSNKEIENRLEIIIFNYEKANKNISNKKIKNYKNIENVINYIDNHYLDSNFSIKYMASYMGTTSSNLSQYFKKYTGRNMSEYLDSLRIKYAKEQLDKGGLTINELSVMLGYSNASAFIKKFKRFTGMTPGEYRQMKGCKIIE